MITSVQHVIADILIDFDQTIGPPAANPAKQFRLFDAGVPVGVVSVSLLGQRITVEAAPFTAPDLVQYLGPPPPLRTGSGAILEPFTSPIPFP